MVGRRAASRDPRDGERGTALVEFAIVVPLFLMLVFGVIAFGVTYNDYISVRQGAREAARQGAVGDFAPAYTTGVPCYLTGASAASSNIKNLICLAKNQIGLDATNTRVKVLSGAPNFIDPGTFQKGESLIVCAQYPLDAVSGVIAPFLSDAFLRTKTSIRIEKSDISATGGEETALSGSDWSWCTVSGSSP